MADIDLTTVDDVKDAIQLPDTSTDLDAILPTYITDASRLIMNHCKREFAPVSHGLTRRFAITSYRVDFTPWDLQSATTVALHPETTQPVILSDVLTGGSTKAYALKPVNASRGVYQSLQFSGFLVVISQTLMQFNFALVDITGTWGFPEVPEDVKRACEITVGSWATRTAPGASTPYAIPSGAGQGAIIRTNDWHIPWAAKKILEPYKRGSSRWAI